MVADAERAVLAKCGIIQFGCDPRALGTQDCCAASIPMNAADQQELKEARALWLQDRCDEALAKFDAVLMRHPDHPLALIDAARAFGGRYQIAKAETLVDRYLATAGRTAAALALAGQTYRMIHRGRKALDSLKEAAGLSAPDAATGLELAMLLDRAGEMEAAEAVLSGVLARDPGFAEGRFFRAHVAIRRGDAEQALPELEAIAGETRHHPYLRTRACYALAEAVDRAGDAAGAIDQALRAKEFGAPDADPLRRIDSLIRKQGDQLARAFTPAKLAQWQREAGGHPPLVLLTGSPRSGTTLIEKVLDAHPGLRSSDEHDLFARFIAPPVLQPPGKAGTGDAGKRLLAADARRAAKMRATYFAGMEELLGEPLAGRVMLDKNPSLTELIPAWLRMAPHSKILVMLRDPRDVVLSCFLNYFPLNAFSVSFLTLEHTARRYVREMDCWLRLRDKLPPDQWRETRYEDCVDDLRGTAGGVIGWMGLEWSDDVMDYRETLARRLTGSPTYADVRAPVHRRAVGKWRRYEEWLAPVQPILAPLVRRFGYEE